MAAHIPGSAKVPVQLRSLRAPLSALLCAALPAILAAPTHAAWVWVYEGSKHVVLPPEEGQPPWAAYPDANADGRPDPVLSAARLRLEGETGATISRARVGQTIRLVATPELGALETETLAVTFRLTGPGGDVVVTADGEIAQPGPVGTAPPLYCATYTIPEDPVDAQVGEHWVGVEVKLGEASLASDPVRLRVVGARATAPEKISREVSHGLKKAGERVTRFATRLAEDVALAFATNPDDPRTRLLLDAQPREAAAMAREATQAPGSALPEAPLLDLERAAAVRTRSEPLRSLLIVPLGKRPARPPAPDEPASPGPRPIGCLGLQRLRVPTATDVPAVVPARGGPFHVFPLVLVADRGAAEGTVGFLGASGVQVAEAPATLVWLDRLPWPGVCEVRAVDQPDEEHAGMVRVKLVATVPEGAVRVELLLPIVVAG